MTSATPVTKSYTTSSGVKVNTKNIREGLVHGREGMECVVVGTNSLHGRKWKAAMKEHGIGSL